MYNWRWRLHGFERTYLGNIYYQWTIHLEQREALMYRRPTFNAVFFIYSYLQWPLWALMKNANANFANLLIRSFQVLFYLGSKGVAMLRKHDFGLRLERCYCVGVLPVWGVFPFITGSGYNGPITSTERPRVSLVGFVYNWTDIMTLALKQRWFEHLRSVLVMMNYFYLIWRCKCSTMGVNIFNQFSRRGVYLCDGMGTFLNSSGETFVRLVRGGWLVVDVPSTPLSTSIEETAKNQDWKLGFISKCLRLMLIPRYVFG